MRREGRGNAGGSTEDLFGPAWEGAGGEGLIPTRALLRCRSRRRVLEKVRSVRRFFPELEGAAIRVGLTRTARGYAAVSVLPKATPLRSVDDVAPGEELRVSVVDGGLDCEILRISRSHGRKS